MLIVVFLLICKSAHARYFNGAHTQYLKSSNMQHINKLTSSYCETRSTNFITCKSSYSCGNQTCLDIKNDYNRHCQTQL